jgi:hypothetical protein
VKGLKNIILFSDQMAAGGQQNHSGLCGLI